LAGFANAGLSSSQRDHCVRFAGPGINVAAAHGTARPGRAIFMNDGTQTGNFAIKGVAMPAA
jgi:hypothetical protein